MKHGVRNTPKLTVFIYGKINGQVKGFTAPRELSSTEILVIHGPIGRRGSDFTLLQVNQRLNRMKQKLRDYCLRLDQEAIPEESVFINDQRCRQISDSHGDVVFDLFTETLIFPINRLNI